MSREYSSARAQAQRPVLPAGELPGPDAPPEVVLGWVARDPARARLALALAAGRRLVEHERGHIDLAREHGTQGRQQCRRARRFRQIAERACRGRAANVLGSFRPTLLDLYHREDSATSSRAFSETRTEPFIAGAGGPSSLPPRGSLSSDRADTPPTFGRKIYEEAFGKQAP